MRRAFFWLARQFSTYNHPLRVGITDGTLSFAALVFGAMITNSLWNASAPDGTSYSVNYGSLAAVSAALSLVVASLSALAATVIQSRPYLVRSASRTVWWTVAIVTLPGAVVWLAAMAYYQDFNLLWLTDLVGFFGPITAFMGYRSLGFYDPNGIAKLLRQNKYTEAHVVMAATAAARGLTWYPRSDR